MLVKSKLYLELEYFILVGILTSSETMYLFKSFNDANEEKFGFIFNKLDAVTVENLRC